MNTSRNGEASRYIPKESGAMKKLSKEDCLIIGYGLTLLGLGGIIMFGFNFISLGLFISAIIPTRWAYIKHNTW